MSKNVKTLASSVHRIKCKRCGRILIVTAGNVRQRMAEHSRTHKDDQPT